MLDEKKNVIKGKKATKKLMGNNEKTTPPNSHPSPTI